MAKRYYWLKLPDGFFRQKAIKKLRKIAGGDTYTIIYLKMLLVAMKQDGRLYFEGVEATFYDELALDLDEEVENVRVTVMFLIQQDLMQLIDETEYSLSECSKMTGSESASAERMRRLRDKKASQCDIEVTEQLRIGDVEKEIEKEIEKDKETENRRKAGKETENEMPPVPSNGVSQAPPVVVSGLSFGNFGNYSEIKECYSEEKGTYPEVIENPSGEKGNPQRDNGRNSIPPQGVTAGGSSETLLHMNLQTIGIRKEQTVNAITALARRKELGGPGGTLWKILSNEYRPTLLKKNEPGDYILWALNHPTEFENTYNGTLKKLIRGR